MPTCFYTVTGGAGMPFMQDKKADGSARTDFAQCEWIVLSGADYGNWQQLVSMSPAEGSAIGMQIGVVWAIAYGFKLIRRALLDNTRADD